MRRTSIVLATAVAALGMATSMASAAPVSNDGPPFPYKDCLAATKEKGESPSQSTWHCDQLVKKGWVKPAN
ncbi:hypothetical protein ACIREE_39630 [Streptomyces sp. NPDC102467]|uniref:hypothetical protein n=1 Tax=Streptomyces sp. NPDC102467 TaxID=3366179 RepID=UPI0038055CC2